MLPVKVTPPINMERMMVTRVTVAEPGASAAQPTNKLAIPPKPLNSATISGMAVICTKRAARPPIIAPTRKPITIH